MHSAFCILHCERLLDKLKFEVLPGGVDPGRGERQHKQKSTEGWYVRT
jgi:hypothetical protein